MSIGVVWVQGVRHVGADAKRRAARALVQAFHASLAQRSCDAFDRIRGHRARGAARRLASDFFVVKVHNHAHASRVRQRLIRRGVHQRVQRCVTTRQVIQTAAVNELILRPTDRARLRVAQL